MDIFPLFKGKGNHLSPWRWLVILLVVVGLSQIGQSSAAQANPWLRGQIGIRWVLWMHDLYAGCKHDLLTTLNDPSSAELLLNANSCGAVVVDPRTVTRVWDYEFELKSGDMPLLQDNTLYFRDVAFDALTGRRLWQVPLTSYGELLLTDDTLYILEHHELRAVNPENGRPLWQVPIIHRGSMLPTRDALYIVGHAGTWAVNPLNGQSLWHSPTPDRTALPARPDCKPPILSGDTLVVNEICGLVRGLDAHTGQLRWQRSGLTLQGFAAGIVYTLDELGQMVALDGVSGQVRWVYPATDAAGTYAAPPLNTWGIGPLIDEQMLYTVDLDGRIVALEAGNGLSRWVSDPVVFIKIDIRSGLHRLGQTLVASSNASSPSPFIVGLDTNTGKTLWRREDLAGHLAAVVDNDILLVQQFRPEGIRLMHLLQAESGQLLGTLTVEEFIDPAVFVESEHDFVYFKRGSFVYAIGPAAPGEAVAMARTFLARGDYRSAARTLSTLKIADEQGYLTNEGQAVATEALNTWLAEAETLLANKTIDNWPRDLRDEVERLEIQEARTRLAGPQEEPLLPPLELGGPTSLDWGYVPVILPTVVFLVSVGANRKRENIYRAGIMAGLSCWGGLVYLFWLGILPVRRNYFNLFDKSPFGFDVALIGGVPLAVWLLTRSKSYTLIAFVLSAIHRYLLYALLTIPLT